VAERFYAQSCFWVQGVGTIANSPAALSSSFISHFLSVGIHCIELHGHAIRCMLLNVGELPIHPGVFLRILSILSEYIMSHPKMHAHNFLGECTVP
jgi:hypothetical protein